MDELDESLNSALERALSTYSTMDSLAEAPYSWQWAPVPSSVFWTAYQSVLGLQSASILAIMSLRIVGGEWDFAIADLLEDISMGQQMARLKFKNDPARLRLFEGLPLKDRGREARHRQALDFETSWARADAAWIFKEGVTLEVFRQRRRALRDLEEACYAAMKEELFARASLRTEAARLNEMSMEWYEAATITFAADTVPGQLIRSIPTTYDPNRPPGPLVFTRAASEGAGRAELTWRSPRARRFTLYVMRPGATDWEPLLTGTEEHSWSAGDLAPGRWRFKGCAKNNFGEGSESEVVEIAVAAMAETAA